MNEMENLRDAAAKQEAKDRAEAFYRYMDETLEEAIATKLFARKVLQYEIVAFALVIVSLMTPWNSVLYPVAYMIWFMSLVFQNIVEQAAESATGRFVGAVRVLRILGYIDDNDAEDRNRKIEKFKENSYKELWHKLKSVFRLGTT